MSTSKFIYEDLRTKIVNGNIAATADLTEAELVNQYSVSRSTIKKVLLMLAGEQYITMEPNKGAKIKTYSVQDVLDHLETRIVLEGLIAKLATPHLTKKEITKLDDTITKMKEHSAQNKLLDHSAQNLVFHQIIYDACPNKTTVSLNDNIKEQIRKYNTKTILVPGRPQAAVVEHQKIVDAIKAKDAILTEKYMIEHVSNVRQTLKDNHALLM